MRNELVPLRPRSVMGIRWGLSMSSGDMVVTANSATTPQTCLILSRLNGCHLSHKYGMGELL